MTKSLRTDGPEADLASLLQLPPRRRLEEVALGRVKAEPALCHRLLEASNDLLFDRPWEALELARLAAETTRQAVAEGHFGRLRCLRLRCDLEVANGWRVVGDLGHAERAFLEVAESLEEEPCGPGLEARLLDFQASLRSDQRRFPEAIELMARALKLYRRAGDTRRQAQAQVTQGYIYIYAGQPVTAVRALRKAIALLDIERDPRLLVICVHNLIHCLNSLGYSLAARSLVSSLRDHHLRLDDEINLLRLTWLEAQIELHDGATGAAEQLLLEVRGRFIGLGLAYDAALVSLELAEIYLRQGRRRRMAELAQEMFPIFQSRAIHREAIAALIVFREAIAFETADLALVKELASYLERARNNPKLRFRK